MESFKAFTKISSRSCGRQDSIRAMIWTRCTWINRTWRTSKYISQKINGTTFSQSLIKFTNTRPFYWQWRNFRTFADPVPPALVNLLLSLPMQLKKAAKVTLIIAFQSQSRTLQLQIHQSCPQWITQRSTNLWAIWVQSWVLLFHSLELSFQGCSRVRSKTILVVEEIITKSMSYCQHGARAFTTSLKVLAHPLPVKRNATIKAQTGRRMFGLQPMMPNTMEEDLSSCHGTIIMASSQQCSMVTRWRFLTILISWPQKAQCLFQQQFGSSCSLKLLNLLCMSWPIRHTLHLTTIEELDLVKILALLLWS